MGEKNAYPLDAQIRAFILILNYCTVDETAEILGDYPDSRGKSPSARVIGDWVRKGELVNMNWYHFREIGEKVLQRQTIDDLKRRTPKDYKKFVQDAEADLDALQDTMMMHLNKMNFKPSDITHIINARRAIHDDSEIQIQMMQNLTKVVGEIIRACSQYTMTVFKDPEVKKAIEFLLAETADEYQRFLVFGGDIENYEVTAGSKAARRGLSSGTEGSGDSRV